MFELKLSPQFKNFLESVEKRPGCKELVLEELLCSPLSRVRNGFISILLILILQISSFIQDLQELKAYTHSNHVDYNMLSDALLELEAIQKV